MKLEEEKSDAVSSGMDQLNEKIKQLEMVSSVV